MDIEAIIFVGIFLGCLFRTVSPFVRKLREAANKNEKFAWNHVYTLTLVVSFIVALASSLIGFAGFRLEPESTTTMLTLFAVSFVYGVGLNSVINEVAGWF